MTSDDERNETPEWLATICWNSARGLPSTFTSEEANRIQWDYGQRGIALAAAEMRLAAICAVAQHAIDGLADVVCVHGASFDSNEYPDWDSYCSCCAAMRPLVLAAQPAAPATGEGETR